VTPTSQVHRGVLGGAPVAIKLLRPGLAASVRRDLALLEGLVPPLGAAFPALDAGAVVREFRQRVRDELDLEHEAAAQRRFHRALRNHAFLTVPAPVTRLARQGVLVSDWVDGVPLWCAPDPDEAAVRMVLFALGATRTGIVHADPDPDDFLVMADGRLAILDFGATREVQPDRVAATASALDAFASDDEDRFGDALARLGWLPASRAPGALALAHDVLGELGGPEAVRLDTSAVLAARDRLLDRPDALSELILFGGLPPQDLWPARGVAQLFGTIARVGATGNWVELARAAIRDGWSARMP
jgi:predicted unusual protein kinase regulating ubiquinone biosynthesis (AarF/ABC1/UbiB family)